MFVEMQRGRGFGGLTRYCLGPGEAGAADRVEAVETLNLATRDPEAAWRVMAARHYLQDDLKAANGIRRGSPGKPVGHLLISWGAEEAEAQNLNPEGMLDAARGALAAMGAGDRQAIVIAHRDTENPHCHCIINLIGEDGRLKDNTDEKRKLSRWAMDHETRVHGAPVVRGRYRNWQDREAGETPPPVRKKARHLYELEKAAEAGAVDPGDAAAMLDAQRSLERRKERRETRDADHRRRLKELRDERVRRAEAWGRSAVKKAKTRIRNARRADWDRLYDDQFEERRTFRENEESERGAMENALRLVDWHAQEPVRDKMSRLFSLTANMQSRRDALVREHERQKRATRDRQRRDEAAAVADIRTEQKRRVDAARTGYRRKSAAMQARQRAAGEELDREQRAVTKARNDALGPFRRRRRLRKRDRTAEKAYVDALTAANAPEAEDGRNRDEAGDKGGRKRRPRRERDPRTSRRRRQQRGETGPQHEERLAARWNREASQGEREPDR